MNSPRPPAQGTAPLAALRERWPEPARSAEELGERLAYLVSAPADSVAADTLLIGLGRFGEAIFNRLREGGRNVLAVDFKPALVGRAQGAGLPVRYGDATDPEFLAHLPLDRLEWVIAALPHYDTGVTHEDPRQVLLATLKAQGYRGKVALCTYDPTEADELRAAGATVVFSPHADAAACAATFVLGEDAPPAVAAAVRPPDA